MVVVVVVAAVEVTLKIDLRLLVMEVEFERVVVSWWWVVCKPIIVLS